MERRVWTSTLVAFALLACNAPPRGEALIVVDTDMPVPTIVDNLRVDIYSPDGSQWWVSRDIYLPDAQSWPVSFSVYTDDMRAGASAIVRLRAYRSEYVQDYRGEGTVSLPSLGSQWDATTFGQCCTDCTSLCPTYWDPPAAKLPRLKDAQSKDVTPSAEPQPLVTIDRLLLVNLVPGNRGKVSVVLAGACAGTQAVLPDPKRPGPQPSDIQTCVDAERMLLPLTSSTLDPDMSLPPPHSSIQGQFAAQFNSACGDARIPTPTLFDDEVCVHGGVMVFGSFTGQADLHTPTVPRIVGVPSFLMNKYEYSVARFEKALPTLTKQIVSYNDGPSNDPNQNAYPQTCTAYQTPNPAWATVDRNAEPLNCVQWSGARTLCQLDGGDLPTEVQWEYAASVAGQRDKSFVTYPQPLTCSEVSYSRDVINASECYDMKHFGVARVDYGMDVADAAEGGIVGMTGNVAEYVLDAAASMASNCWLSAPIASPSCVQPGAANVILRGSAWASPRTVVSAASRVPTEGDLVSEKLGFRCVR